MDWLRSRAGCVSGCVRLWHPAAAQGYEAGEKRPVVVCQHGLEGRPRNVIAGDNRAYHDFAARLAERGFITSRRRTRTSASDRFRTLQRKANPLEQALFSIIVPQHQQIVDWLESLPFVDPQRIAFYGLCYGGKTAMRMPALVKNYCLSICSADFNDWVWKNASTRQSATATLDGRVRDLRVRPGQHVQLRRDGGPDRPAAVHGRARPLRRRGSDEGGRTSMPRSATCTRPS